MSLPKYAKGSLELVCYHGPWEKSCLNLQHYWLYLYYIFHTYMEVILLKECHCV